jgi:hypothetical protein
VTPTATHQTAETQFIDADGVRFAFRSFGAPGATPLHEIPLGWGPKGREFKSRRPD